MADEKAMEKDQKVAEGSPVKKEELSEKDLDKASGGTWTWTDGGAPKA